jgi:thioredoxin 1
MITEIAPENLETVISTESKLLLVDFYTKTCAPCHRMVRVLGEIAEELQDSVTFVKVDAAQDYQVSAKFKVSSVPSLLLFKNGELQARRIGEISQADLKKWIAESV